MTYDHRRITGFIAAVGFAGAAATAAAQGASNRMADWDVDRDARVSADEFRTGVDRDLTDQAPWRAQAPRGFEDPEGDGVDNLYDFGRYDADQDQMLNEEEFATFSQETGWEGDYTAYDADADAMISEPEYYGGLDAAGAPHRTGAAGAGATGTAGAAGTAGAGMDREYDFSVYDTDADERLGEEEFQVFSEERGGEDDFVAYDSGRDRFVDRDEFAAGIAANQPIPRGTSGQEIDNLYNYDFGAFDTDRSGYLEDTEFTAFEQERNRNVSTSLFERMDLNGNGLVSESEYEEFTGQDMWHTRGTDGEVMPVEQPEFSEFDRDGDGFIGPDEMDEVRAALNI